MAAIIGFCYLLPTTTKKMVYAHQYILDFFSGATDAMDVIGRNVVDRRQPYLQAIGSSWADVSSIAVYSDGTAVCSFTNVAKGLCVFFSLHYLLDIQYSGAVHSTLQFLEIKCLKNFSKPRTGVQILLNEVE